MRDLSVLLRRISESGLDFVVVGGFAAVTHGSSFVTRDVDICAVLTTENIERLRSALAEWDPRHRLTPQRLSFLTHPSDTTPVANLYLETQYGVVDILTSVLGVAPTGVAPTGSGWNMQQFGASQVGGPDGVRAAPVP